MEPEKQLKGVIRHLHESDPNSISNTEYLLLITEPGVTSEQVESPEYH